jgi:hypothetical protein
MGLHPAATNSLTTFPPIKPVAPVIKTTMRGLPLCRDRFNVGFYRGTVVTLSYDEAFAKQRARLEFSIFQ